MRRATRSSSASAISKRSPEAKDFDEQHKEMVRAAGFAAAFSTEVGAAVRGRDLFQVPRSRPWDANPFLFGLRLLRWLAQE
jgi:hypothetical protein